jgi:hypothetical protein
MEVMDHIERTRAGSTTHGRREAGLPGAVRAGSGTTRGAARPETKIADAPEQGGGGQREEGAAGALEAGGGGTRCRWMRQARADGGRQADAESTRATSSN